MENHGIAKSLSLVGLVIDGWPIAHHVFHGNLRDSTTVEKVLQDLQARFGLRRVVFVCDQGMVTSGNLDRLRSSGQGYLLGLKRRRQPEILRYLEGATGPWLECPAGISAREKSQVPQTLVQQVAAGKPGVRVFVVHSDERLEYERGEREKAMQKVQEELQALEQRVAKGKLQAPEKIGAAASPSRPAVLGGFCRKSALSLPRIPILRLGTERRPVPLFLNIRKI
jgi:transposase